VRLGIVGLGHIGGSLLVRLSSRVDVVGFDSDPRARGQLREAWGVATVDSLGEIVRGCDFVVVCVPTPELENVLAELEILCGVDRRLKVMEVSSVKPFVPYRFPHLDILATHPMAGREGSGAASADPEVFKEATWLFVLDGDESDDDVYSGLSLVTKRCGAYVLGMNVESHNAVIAAVSDLAHVSALGLAQVAERVLGPDVVRSVAAGSYRDATRVARGSAARVAELLIPNRRELAPLVKEMGARLIEFADILDGGALDQKVTEEAIARWVAVGTGSAHASARGHLVEQSPLRIQRGALGTQVVALGTAGLLVKEVVDLGAEGWELTPGKFDDKASGPFPQPRRR